MAEKFIGGGGLGRGLEGVQSNKDNIDVKVPDT